MKYLGGRAALAGAALALLALGADVRCYPAAAPKSPWERMADPASIPTYRGDRAIRFSSYDRGLAGETIWGPGNKDFNHFLAVCGSAFPLYYQTSDDLPCEPGADGYLLAKVSGESGWVSRMWFAKFPEDLLGNPWHAQRLVVYVDDLETPAVDVPLAEIAAGTRPPFTEPFAGRRSGGLASYAPIPFARELRVYVRGADGPADVLYHHVDVLLSDHPVAPYAPLPSAGEIGLRRDAAATLSQRGRNPNEGFAAAKDRLPAILPAGKETTLYEDPGAGVVEAFEIAFSARDARRADGLALRMTWDGEAAPAVDVPLRSFFGEEFEDVPYESLFLGLRETDAETVYYCYLPMPFRSGARISVVNAGERSVVAAVTVGVDRTLPEEPFGALRVVRNAVDFPPPEARRHVVADLEGTGALAGAFLSIRGRSDPALLFPQPRNYLEGDERIAVDGRTLLGTGTEEISDGAWYFRGAFDSPFSGALLARNADAVWGETAQYRWRLPSDGLYFRNSLRYETDYALERPELIARYVSTAYLYLLP